MRTTLLPGNSESALGGDRRPAVEQLATEDDDIPDGGKASGGSSFLAELKADPGRLGLDTLFNEIDKLARVRSLGLQPDLFHGESEKLVASWRARAAKQYPSHMRKSPRPVRLTMLATLTWERTSEITDSLVDLLVALVHKINAKAERRVESEVGQGPEAGFTALGGHREGHPNYTPA